MNGRWRAWFGMCQRCPPRGCPQHPPRFRHAVIQEECLEDLRHWVDTNRKTALRVLDLMEAALRAPSGGIGKPEHLKHFGGNVWSRRIDVADRWSTRCSTTASNSRRLATTTVDEIRGLTDCTSAAGRAKGAAGHQR